MEHKEIQESQQYLTFRVGEEEYALGILRVKEIIEVSTITRIPEVPDWVRGVINLRGAVIPVIDLAVKFAGAPSTITKLTCIVIVEIAFEGEEMLMGLMADAVNQVIDLAPSDIEPPPPFGTFAQLEYLIGMGKLGAGFTLILDIDRLLTTSDLLKTAAAALESPDLDASALVAAAAVEAATGETPCA